MPGTLREAVGSDFAQTCAFPASQQFYRRVQDPLLFASANPPHPQSSNLNGSVRFRALIPRG